jgi:seryl-tRNA synthetase
MTPTPRTDAAANDSIVKVYETSKQLERELAEARVQRDTLAEALNHTVDRINDFEDYHAGRRKNLPSISAALKFAQVALAAVKGDKP